MFQFIDISCDCGNNLARGALVLCASDARRITTTLSHHCHICRDRRLHSEPHTGAPLLRSKGGVQSFPEPRVLSEPRTSVSGSSAPESEVYPVPA